MTAKNKIFLIGNGFDIAHGFKTTFSDFAEYYFDKILLPELSQAIKNKQNNHSLFEYDYLTNMSRKAGGVIRENNSEDLIWHYSHGNQIDKLKEHLQNKYNLLGSILKNQLMAKLYAGKEKNWFDIENKYFRILVSYKNMARNSSHFKPEMLEKLNKEFALIKEAVKDYLNTIQIETDESIGAFLKQQLGNTQSAYVINFNYTSSVKQYIENSEKITVNHVHGSLKEDSIIFGYGNDQNTDYQEIKDLGNDEFLRHFKTFDYLNNRNYDLVYSKALERYDEYEVYVLGHSLGLTDKTLLSEIFNSDKCKKIYFFKRSDLKEHPKKLKEKYRELTYSASRIITNENLLRKKVVNYEESLYFPN